MKQAKTTKNDIEGLVDYLQEASEENYHNPEASEWFSRCAEWVKMKIEGK